MRTQSEIIIPENFFEEIAKSEEKFCLEIRHCNPNDVIGGLLSGYKSSFNLLNPFLNLYERPKILEVGSGNGFGICYLLKQGLDVIGIEPGSEIGYEGRFERAVQLLEANEIRPASSYLFPAFSEDLPFEDNTFDIVFSMSVIEHVQDIKRTMQEALRVLKPNGAVIMHIPNYNSFEEGHYNIKWLPYVLSNKKVAKWYVRTVYRRPDYFIDELNFTTPRYFKRLAKRLPECASSTILYSSVYPFGMIADYHYYNRLPQILDSARKTPAPTQRLSLLKRMLLTMMGFTTRSLSYFGFAPTFNVVFFKRPDGASTSTREGRSAL